MKRDQLEQYVNEFKNIDSIQKMEDKIIENYPYLDKIDINDIIIGCLEYQNESSIQAKRESFEETRLKMLELEHLLSGTMYSDLIKKYLVSCIIQGGEVSFLTYSFITRLNASTDSDKTIATACLSAASIIATITFAFRVSLDIDPFILNLIECIKQNTKLSKELKKQNININDLKKELKKVRIEWSIIKEKLGQDNYTEEINNKLNNYLNISNEDYDVKDVVEDSKQKVLCR